MEGSWPAEERKGGLGKRRFPRQGDDLRRLRRGRPRFEDGRSVRRLRLVVQAEYELQQVLPQGGGFQMPTFQNNAYPGQSSAPVSSSMNRFDNMDRFGSIPNQPQMQTLINQAQPAPTNQNQAPVSNQGMPQWSGGGNWNIPPPPSDNGMATGNTMSSFGQLPSNGQPSYSQQVIF